MQLTAALLSLLAPFLPLTHSLTLSPRGPPIKCIGVWDVMPDFECLMPWKAGYLLLPDFWHEQSLKIPDDRTYENLDKIICSPDDETRLCAFIEQMEKPIGKELADDPHYQLTGRQVKELMERLAHRCDKSRCASIRAAVVDGIDNLGWLTVDQVKQTGDCRGYCEPWQS